MNTDDLRSYSKGLIDQLGDKENELEVLNKDILDLKIEIDEVADQIANATKYAKIVANAAKAAKKAK